MRSNEISRRAAALGFGVLLLGALPAVALEDRGAAVGTTVPDIGAPLDQTGKPRTLASLAGKNGTVFLFFRSADWCPYCQRQLMDLNAGLADIEKRGFKMAALSYDSPEILAKFTEKREIKFTLLSDPRSEVIDRYGLRDPQYAGKPKFDGVPRPIIFILDPKGVIKAKLYEESYKDRPPVDQVLAKIDEVAAK
ncbi:MAG: peroxiredoxin family protein [Rhodospirillaceae bacterium]|nr:peroxiredoxin family protein [Rhodospirillaceae bacterium]